MLDLRNKLGDTWQAACRLTMGAQSGRAVMFIAARCNEGTSSLAASFALLASDYADKPVWLIDLEFRRNQAFTAFEDGFIRGIGPPGRAYDASLRQKQIYTLSPASETARQEKMLTVHEIEGERLLVSRFRTENIQPGQQVQVQTSAEWWQAVRKIASWTIVDAPALERSPAGLAMASQMSGVILVVQADRTSPEEVEAARQEIQAHGGTLLGVVMNQVRADARLVERCSG